MPRNRILAALVPMAPVAAFFVAMAPAAAGAAPGPLPDGPPVAGEMISVSGHGCMDNMGGNDPLDGVTNPVQLSKCNTAANGQSIGKQLWTVEPDSTVRLYFPYNSARATSSPAETATGAYKCLHADADSSVELRDCSGTSWEDWTFQQVTGDDYVLKVTGQFSPPGGTAPVTRCLAEQGANQKLLMTSCDPSDKSQQWQVPASKPLNEAAPAILDLQSTYDQTGGLFTDPSDPVCSTKSRENYISKTDIPEYGGNCWWWAASGLYAMTDFLDHAGSSWLGAGSIASDLARTYSTLCGNSPQPCPVKPLSGQTHTDKNLFQNSYFDDTSNWGLTWLNAYWYTKDMGKPDQQYLYLAENLWYYVTRYGWDHGGNKYSCGYPGGIVQTTTSADPSKNVGVNSLYLRLSAWLYATTKGAAYRDGITDSDHPAPYGGYVQEANWLFPVVTTPDPPGSNVPPITFFDQQTFPSQPLIFYGDIDPKGSPACSVDIKKAKETQHEGTMLGALASLYQAAQISTGSAASQLNDTPSFYLEIADNLAETMMTDTTLTTPPAVTADGVLNESGDPVKTVEPAGTVESMGGEPAVGDAWLPGKGIFMRNLYCLGHTPLQAGTMPADDTITNFVQVNAQSVAQKAQDLDADNPNATAGYNEFGYWWQGDPYQKTGAGFQNFATQLSAAEALSAGLGSAATAMC